MASAWILAAQLVQFVEQPADVGALRFDHRAQRRHVAAGGVNLDDELLTGGRRRAVCVRDELQGHTRFIGAVRFRQTGPRRSS